MSSVFNPKRLGPLLWIGAAAALAKVIWVVVEWSLPLPTVGVEHTGSGVQHALHYRYRLASEAELKAPPKPTKRPSKTPKAASLAGYKLVGIYSTPERAIVTLMKGTKSTVVSTGPNGGDVAGYHLKEADATTAVFVRGAEKVTLKLFDKKTGSSSRSASPVSSSETKSPPRAVPKEAAKQSAGIVERGDTKVIRRTLIEEYTQNPEKIWKNIGLYEVKNGGKLDGFKVRFVRRGSPFEKLGLKRGDVIKAINGEPITDYATPMRMLRDADTIDDLSLTIERNHEEQELKYEVQ
jgi:general secretion pathway protein C